MPFGFRRKNKQSGPPITDARGSVAGLPGGAPFDGLTEEWRLVGVMHVNGRLSDALNKREAIAIHDVRWAPIDGSAGFAECSMAADKMPPLPGIPVRAITPSL